MNIHEVFKINEINYMALINLHNNDLHSARLNFNVMLIISHLGVP